MTDQKPMTDERLAEIRGRCEAMARVTSPVTLRSNWLTVGWEDATPVCDFLEHAREDLPDCLAEIGRLQVELQRYQDLDDQHRRRRGAPKLKPATKS